VKSNVTFNCNLLEVDFSISVCLVVCTTSRSKRVSTWQPLRAHNIPTQTVKLLVWDTPLSVLPLIRWLPVLKILDPLIHTKVNQSHLYSCICHLILQKISLHTNPRDKMNKNCSEWSWKSTLQDWLKPANKTFNNDMIASHTSHWKTAMGYHEPCQCYSRSRLQDYVTCK